MFDIRPHIALALVAAAALLPVSACGEGSSGSEDADAAEGQAVSQQSSSDGSSSQSQTIESDSGSVIQQSSSSSSSSQSQVQQSSGEGGITMLSGSGRSEVELSVSRPSRLSWTNTEGELFRLEAPGEDLSISSRAGGGEVDLDAGDLSGVEIDGDLWTVVVRPE